MTRWPAPSPPARSSAVGDSNESPIRLEHLRSIDDVPIDQDVLLLWRLNGKEVFWQVDSLNEDGRWQVMDDDEDIIGWVPLPDASSLARFDG